MHMTSVSYSRIRYAINENRPAQNKAGLDKSHYLLADWQGILLPTFGAIHIHRQKPVNLI